jgi:hypothetical protein
VQSTEFRSSVDRYVVGEVPDDGIFRETLRGAGYSEKGIDIAEGVLMLGALGSGEGAQARTGGKFAPGGVAVDANPLSTVWETPTAGTVARAQRLQEELGISGYQAGRRVFLNRELTERELYALSEAHMAEMGQFVVVNNQGEVRYVLHMGRSRSVPTMTRDTLRIDPDFRGEWVLQRRMHTHPQGSMQPSTADYRNAANSGGGEIIVRDEHGRITRRVITEEEAQQALADFARYNQP